jgi:6-phosphogluconolactonase
VVSSGGDRVAREAAERIAAVLRAAVGRAGRATIALSGGNTPRGAYAILASQSVDWSKVSLFWVDERAVPPVDDRSNYRWAKATLIDGVCGAIDAKRVHRMPADDADLDAAARAYEKVLRGGVATDTANPGAVPAFDVVVLGVGEDGHTASLFPGEPTIDVRDRLVAAVPALGAREARLTLTPPPIETARNVFVLAVGAGKREPLGRAWAPEGDIHRTPARLVRECRGVVTWLVDEAAVGSWLAPAAPVTR